MTHWWMVQQAWPEQLTEVVIRRGDADHETQSIRRSPELITAELGQVVVGSPGPADKAIGYAMMPPPSP
jgi:hypothetical protein